MVRLPRSPRFRPALEALEDRLALSTLTVLNAGDHGAGSLRQAIHDAHDGDSIVFAAKVHDITLTTGELDVTKDISIAGAGRVTISGNDASRVFHIESGADVHISGLTIAHGRAVAARDGVSEDFHVHLPDPTPEDDVDDTVLLDLTFSRVGGGGIYNEAGGRLTLTDAVLTANRVVGADGYDALGGALLNDGYAYITRTSFTGNAAVGGAAFDAIGGSGGGAIDNFGGGELHVIDSVFRDNRTVSAAGAYYALGGAIEANAGFLGYGGFVEDTAVPATTTLTNCLFVGNVAQGGEQATANGGAIMSEGLGVQMTLTNCVIVDNRAVGGANARDNSPTSVTFGQGIGGGIMNIGVMTIDGCTISDNEAVGGNNASASAANPNIGGAFGGGIETNGGSDLTITNSVISGNRAVGGDSTRGAGGNAIGGGISNSPFGTLHITGSYIVDNEALGGTGKSGGIADGGGVDTSFLSHTTITNSVIAGNRAVGGAGLAGYRGGDGVGGGVAVGFNAYVDPTGANGFPEGSSVTLVNCLVANNQAVGGTGGKSASGGDGKGGGIFLFSRVATEGTTTSEATVSLTRTLVIGNEAIGGRGGKGGITGKGLGGGAYNEKGDLTAGIVALILGNHATTSGNNVYHI